MIFISTRHELDNEDKLGVTSYWDLKIDGFVEDHSSRERLTRDDVQKRLKDKTILILVHGYNNEFEDITRAYDIIRKKVVLFAGGWYDEVIGFTWPGGDNPLDWYAPKRRAGIVGPRLAEFINRVLGSTTTVDLMSHSLGARVVLSALDLLTADSVRANFLTASAVDNEVIEPGEKYHSSVRQNATESVVFHSKNDFVLKSAYRIAEWDNPLGLLGPENPASIIEHLPNVTVCNCKRIIKGHGEYKSNDAIYRFMNNWLNGDVETQFTTLR